TLLLPPPLPTLPAKSGTGGEAGLNTVIPPQPFWERMELGIIVWICVAVMAEAAGVMLFCTPLMVKLTVETCVGSVVLERKFVPVMVIGSPPGPTAPDVTPLIAGTLFGGLLTMKMTVFDSPLLPDPENGLWVNTEALPGLAVRLAGTTAVRKMTVPDT